MRNLLAKILGLIYPEPLLCPGCSKELQSWGAQLGLCPDCVDDLHLFSPVGTAGVSGLEEQYFDQVQGVALYGGLIKDWIYRLKYYGEKELAFPLVELMVEQGVTGEWDGIIPIPLHETKLHKRGFNQALLLAQGLAFHLQIPCVEGLIRVKETLPQNKLKPGERQQNLQGVFVPRPGVEIQGKRLLLIDDIFTTGTTVNEAARVLKLAGSEHVGVFVLASGRMM